MFKVKLFSVKMVCGAQSSLKCPTIKDTSIRIYVIHWTSNYRNFEMLKTISLWKSTTPNKIRKF